MTTALARRRALLRAGFAFSAGTLLLPRAWAHEYFTPRFTVVHPWTRASAEGAATAAIGMHFEDVSLSDRLIDARSPLAGAAELVGADGATRSSLEIPVGQVTTFGEGGAHVRLLALMQRLELGREYPLTLVFEQAGALKASFLVDFPAAG